MRTFLIIWLGQFASLLGSEMTNFAITIWAWDVTGQATPLAMIGAVSQIPRLLISPFAGVWVDRFNRKYLMLVGDTVAGLSTIALFLLLLSDNLQIWHLYISGAVNGLFGYVQGLAHSASMSLLVDKKHYARISALESLQFSGSYVVVPFIAGAIYSVTGLQGIFAIDLGTFVVAIASLTFVAIPKPPREAQEKDIQNAWQSLKFGLNYLWTRTKLRIFLCFFIVVDFIASLSFSILPAMILARLGNDAASLGTVFSFFGIGGVCGGITLSIWGGPKKRIHGLLIAWAVWQMGLVFLAFAPNLQVILGTALVSGFCSPFPGSCAQAIWRSQIKPELQGRIFSTRFLLTQLATPAGAAIAGILADRIFEPILQGQYIGFLNTLFGEGLGAGMSLQVAIFSTLGMVITLGSYSISPLRNIEAD